MAENPFISICIPAFQRANYLKRLLDSIEIQSFRVFEVVITDDSPGMEVSDLIEIHALRPMIRYFKNVKTLGSRKTGMKGFEDQVGIGSKSCTMTIGLPVLTACCFLRMPYEKAQLFFIFRHIPMFFRTDI